MKRAGIFFGRRFSLRSKDVPGGFMQFFKSQRALLACVAVFASAVMVASLAPAQKTTATVVRAGATAAATGCPEGDAGLKLPAGFCASVFADGIGHARHMAVASNGVLYVNTWSGTYYGNETPHEGGFLVALQDKAGKGRAD